MEGVCRSGRLESQRVLLRLREWVEVAEVVVAAAVVVVTIFHEKRRLKRIAGRREAFETLNDLDSGSSVEIRLFLGADVKRIDVRRVIMREKAAEARRSLRRIGVTVSESR